MKTKFHPSKWGFYTRCSFHTQFSIMKVFFHATPQVPLHQDPTCHCSFRIPDHDCLNYGYADHLHQQLPDYLEQIVLRLTFNPPPHPLSPLKKCHKGHSSLLSQLFSPLDIRYLTASPFTPVSSSFHAVDILQHLSICSCRWKDEAAAEKHITFCLWDTTFLFAMLMKYS